MPEPSHQEIQELLGVYALDAVDKETADLVQRHLNQCVRCSIEVAQHHEVAGLLANSGGTSPADLWDGIAGQLDGSAPPSWEGLAGRLETGDDRVDRADRVLGAVDDPATDPSREPAETGSDLIPDTAERRRSRWVARAAGIVAAAAAVVAIVLGVQVHHLDNQVNALQAHPSLSAAEQAALKVPSTKQVQLTAVAGSNTSPTVGKVTVVLTKSGTGFVEAGGLSTLPKGKTYQLWGVIGGNAISLGLLGSAPNVVPFSVAGSVAVNAFAITAEHAGGVVHSTNRPVVAGEVSA
jgi:hypothetical protein